MGRSLSLGLKSTRMGLWLIWGGSVVLSYFLFLHSAITTGLIPKVLAAETFGFAGFMAIFLLATLELGILRWAITTQHDQLSLFYTFFVVSVVACAMTYFSPQRIVAILMWLSDNSHFLLIGCAAAFFAGFAYCLGGGGGLINWIIGVLAMVCLVGSAGCLLAAKKSRWLKGPLESFVDQIPIIGSQAATASLLAGLAIFCQVLYLRNIARHRGDQTMKETSRPFLLCLIIAVPIVSLLIHWISQHRINPGLNAVVDTHQTVLGALVTLAVGVMGLWYAHLVDSTRLLVDYSRRR